MNNIRFNVIFPADLAAEIDRVAGARQRSAFLVAAAREQLARIQFDQALTQSFGAWQDADHPDLADDTGVRQYLQRTRAATNRRLRKRLGHG